MMKEHVTNERTEVPRDTSWKWKFATLLAVVVAGFATLLGTVGDRYVWCPELVYELSERETIFGPKIAREVAEALQRRTLLSMVKGTTERLQAEAAAREPDSEPATENEGDHKTGEEIIDFMASMQFDLLKETISPEVLFPNRYAKVRVANRGRGTAKNVRLVLKVPGVVVEHQVQCASRPGIQTQLIYALDGEVPVGIEIRESEIPELVSGYDLSVEVWYARAQLGEPFRAVYPEWPVETSVEVRHSEGGARRVDPLQTPKVDYKVLWLFLGVVVLVLAAALGITRLARSL